MNLQIQSCSFRLCIARQYPLSVRLSSMYERSYDIQRVSRVLEVDLPTVSQPTQSFIQASALRLERANCSSHWRCDY